MENGFETSVNTKFVAQTRGSGNIFAECGCNVYKEEIDNENTSIELVNYCNIYSNPFNEQLNIDFTLKKEGIVKVELFNIDGKLINTLINEYFSKTDLQTTYSFNVRNLPSSTYICKLTQNNIELQSFKIIKN